MPVLVPVRSSIWLISIHLYKRTHEAQVFEPSWQLHLFFRMGKYLYQAIVTDLDLTPLHVWRFYNDRAEAELVIRELKLSTTQLWPRRIARQGAG